MSARAKVVMLAVALVLFAGIGLRHAIFVNPGELVARRREAVPAEERYPRMARNHSGAGPCLRYPTIHAEDLLDLGRAVEELASSGFADRADQVSTLVNAWSQEEERPAHALSPAEEELSVLAANAGFVDRIAIALHRERILRWLETGQATVSADDRREAERAFEPARLEKLVAIWKAHQTALGGYPFPVGDRVREQLTRDHVDTLAELVRRRALLERRFPASLGDIVPDLDGATDVLQDGWGAPIGYDASASGAKVRVHKGSPIHFGLEREIPMPVIAAGCEGPPPAHPTILGAFLAYSSADYGAWIGHAGPLRPYQATRARRIFQPGALLQSAGVCDGDLLISVASEPWPDDLAPLRRLLPVGSDVAVVIGRGSAEHHVVWQVR